MIDIIIPVFNNALTLDEALESIVRQSIISKATIYIVDDASQDSSYEIAEKWSMRFGNIVATRNSSNIGVMANYRRLLSFCRGTYVAPLEGDDVWISNTRLEKLTEYLSIVGRPACFSGFLVENLVTGTQHENVAMSSLRFRRFSVFEMFDGNPPSSFSNCLYRRDVLSAVFEEINGAVGYDWLVNILIAVRNDGLDFYPEVLSAYRVSSKGAWSSLAEEQKAELIVDTLRSLLERLPRRYASTINRLVASAKRRCHA